MKNASLEGVRGAAALLVVLYHVRSWVPGLGATANGYLAVDVFFVLSGYVICGAYRASLRNLSDARAFVVRRFGRIWPAHIASNVIAFALLFALAAIGHDTNPARLLPPVGEAFAIASFAQGLNLFDHGVGTEVGWSAGDEFYVYAVFAIACLASRGRRRVVAFSVLAMIGYALAVWASAVKGACLTRGQCFDLWFSYGWARCLVGFFFGALIAEYRDHAAVVALTGRIPQTLAFGVVLLLMLFADRVPGSAVAAPVVFAALIASMSRDSGPVTRIFQTRGAQWLGSISYSLYVAHPVFLPELGIVVQRTQGAFAYAIETVLYLCLSFALASILCKRIETPCRHWFNVRANTTFSRGISAASAEGSVR
jgi:peptidoglycan/LPS O-acetylase OafA/YrhL